jgi:obg-like ATPase 1
VYRAGYGPDHLSSDFEQKFVCGEIMAFDDLKSHGSESAVKAAGALRQQGKTCELIDYLDRPIRVSADVIDVMNDGDIAYWKCGQ